MRKKIFTILCSLIVSVSLIGCGAGTAKKADQKADQKVEKKVAVKNKKTLEKEIEEKETEYKKFMDSDFDNMSLSEVTSQTEEMRKLWNNEMDTLLGSIKKEIKKDKKEDIVKGQKKWEKLKKQMIDEAISEDEEIDESARPFYETLSDAEYTRERVYFLAKNLAKIRGEKFTLKYKELE